MKTKAITTTIIILVLASIAITSAAFNQDLIVPRRGKIPFVGMNMVETCIYSRMEPEGWKTDGYQRTIHFTGVPLKPNLEPEDPNYIIMQYSDPFWDTSIVNVTSREIVETTGSLARPGWKVNCWIDPKVRIGSEVWIEDFPWPLKVIGTTTWLSFESKKVSAWVLYGVAIASNGDYWTRHYLYERKTGLLLSQSVIKYNANGDIIVSFSSSLISTNVPI